MPSEARQLPDGRREPNCESPPPKRALGPPDWSSPLARRYVCYTVLFSTLLALLLTAVELVFDYRRGVRGIEHTHRTVLASYADGLQHSLWNLYSAQVQALINGIASVPDIERVELRTANRVYTAGALPTRRGPEYERAISYEFQGLRHPLGTIRLYSSVEPLLKELTVNFAWRLGGNLVKTGLVVLFSLFVFSLLVNRHLVHLATYIRACIADPEQPPLRLPRRAARGDELDLICQALNDLSHQLTARFNEVNHEREALVQQMRLQREHTSDVQREMLRQERLATLGQVAGMLAHEIRNPLGAIELTLLNLQAIEPAHRLPPPMVERMRRQIARIDGLIERVAVCWREPAELQLVDCARWLRDHRYALAQGLSYPLVIACPEQPLTVRVDPELLRIALGHLLQNADQAHAAAGLGPHSQHPIRVHCTQLQSLVYLQVCDRGDGFKLPLDRLAQPLCSTRTYGMGLGLTVVRQLVSVVDGSLAFSRQLGETRVSVRLPAADASPVQRP